MDNTYSRYLIKHSFIYGTGEVLNKAFGLVLIPVYTRYLTTDVYGILQLLLITSSLLTTILQLGMGSAIFKAILHHDKVDKSSTYATAFYFLIGSSIIITLPILFISEDVSVVVTGTAKYALAVKLLLLSIIFKNFAIIPLAQLRIQNRSIQFSTINSLKFLTQLLLTIFFVVFLKKGVEGIIFAELISSIIFAIIFTKIIFPNLRLTFSIAQLKEMLFFGLPLVPAALAMFILNMSDRYFLRYYSTLEEVGLYSLGYRFGMIMALIVTAFQTAWGAAMFRIAKERNAQEIYSRNFTYFLLLLNFAALGLSIFAKDLILLLATKPFASGYKIVPLVSFSYVFFGIYYYTAVGLNLKRKTYYQPVVVVVSCILNLILNYILIRPYGMLGAAISTLISFVFMAFSATKISQRFYFIAYEWKRIALAFMISITTFLLSISLNFDNILISSLYKTTLLLSFPALLFGLGFFTENEKTKIKLTLNNF